MYLKAGIKVGNRPCQFYMNLKKILAVHNEFISLKKTVLKSKLV